MQPINLGNNPWYQLDPIARFISIPDSQHKAIFLFLKDRITTGARTRVLNRIRFWHDTTNARHRAYRDMTSLQSDYETAVNEIIREEAAACQCPMPENYIYRVGPPVVNRDAQHVFYQNFFLDAYFDGTDTQLTDDDLRLFVSTPLFTGPGYYKFLCKNRRIISVALDKNPATKVYFNLVAGHSGKCLAVVDGSRDYSAGVVQMPKSTADHMCWQVEPAGNGQFQFFAKHTGQTLNLPGGTLFDDVQIVQYTPSNSQDLENDHWHLKSMGSHYWQIIAQASEKCIAVSGGSSDDNTQIVQVPISLDPSTMWRFEAI